MNKYVFADIISSHKKAKSVQNVHILVYTWS